MRSHRRGNGKRKGANGSSEYSEILCNISAGGISMKPPGAFYGFKMAYI